jgi:hypothetical protein
LGLYVKSLVYATPANNEEDLWHRIQIHSPAEKAEHHYYLKIYRRGMWLLFFNQSFETLEQLGDD